ncbi:CU044_5270 family protein [Streptomyces uncialis]|uniref:CU044_5270 family protein n=1 Tax=Streptomyces uncialis TaxID=1048205 RepID=UPI0037B86BFB
MNREQQERVEIEEASGILPAVSFPELDPERVRVRRHHLLNEIGGPSGRRGVTAVLRPGRPMAVAWATFTAAGVTATALTFGLSGTESRPDVPPASAASVRLLERAALAADARPLPKSPPRGYTYVRTVGHSTALSENRDGGMDRERTSQDLEQWTSVDGSERTLERKGGGEETLIPESPGEGSLNAPTFEFLAGLPTDSRALLDMIREDAERNHGSGSGSTTGPDQQAFVTIGDLLRGSAAPPDTVAALYRAAALIPGVFTVPEAVDAAGRTGVAVARNHDGERTEWIFDRSTMRLLGERTVLLEDNAWGRAGDTVTSIAVMESGVVDKAGITVR